MYNFKFFKMYRKTISEQPIKVIFPKESKITPLACRICSMCFKRKKDLEDHIRFHPSAKPFACKICGKRFVTDKHLVLHLRYLHGPKVVTCEEGCGKTFVRESDMKAHTILHEKNKPYCCKKCGKRFKTMRFYKTHYNVHITGATFVCASEISGNRGKETAPDSESDEHTNQQKIRDRTGATLVLSSKKNQGKETISDSQSDECTNQQKIRVFTCKVCNKHFKKRFNLKRHCASHASKFFTCVECGPEVKFKDIVSREKHYTTCHFGKPFKCIICNSFFSTKGIRDRHVQIH